MTSGDEHTRECEGESLARLNIKRERAVLLKIPPEGMHANGRSGGIRGFIPSARERERGVGGLIEGAVVRSLGG